MIKLKQLIQQMNINIYNLKKGLNSLNMNTKINIM